MSEIKITPIMVRAGALALRMARDEGKSPERIAQAVFRTMLIASEPETIRFYAYLAGRKGAQ